MNKFHSVRVLVRQRLSVAVEHILVLFDRTVAEYEEEIERQRRLLQAAEQRHQPGQSRSDIQQLLVGVGEEEEDAELPHIKEEEEDAELPHIKEEEEALWGRQQEADISSFPPPPPVKSEDDEAQSSHLHHLNREADTNLDPERYLDQTSDSPEPQTEDEWKETREPQSGSSKKSQTDVSIRGTAKDRQDAMHRLNLVVEEIFELFERITAQYEEDVFHSREEERQLKLLQAIFTPQVHVYRADVQQLLVSKEEPPASSSADHMDADEQEVASSSDPERRLQHAVEDKTSDSSESETEDSDNDWTETREPQPGSNSLKLKDLVGCKKKNSKEKRFSCSICGRMFGRRTHLKVHMCVHTGEKPFSCSVCEKRFGRKSNLQRHMECHSVKKSYECEVCGHRFQQMGYLKNHCRVHTGEKPYSCSVCGKSFSHSTDRLRHAMMHRGEKPFSCSVCGKCFARRHTMDKHMRTHTGEKPYSCTVCGKAFAQRFILQTHMSIHTGTKPHHCSVCWKSFNTPAHIKNHKCVSSQQ